MKRDKKGRFTKENLCNDRYELRILFPSFKTFFFILFLIIIFLPWTIIISRRRILEKIFHFLEDIMTQREEETPKKNGIFY